jgi:integrase/recombinase XerC
MLYKEDFLAYLRFEKRYSEYTIESYSNDLTHYDSFCKGTGSENFQLDPKLIRMWIVSLLEKGISPRSVNRKLSTLKTFAKYLIREGVLTSNPVDKVTKPKMNRRIPSFIDRDRLNEALDSFQFGEDYEGIRNQLIIEILYQTGMRRGELTGLKIGSIDFSNQQIRVLGKRNKERIIPILPDLTGRIRSYIDLRIRTFSGGSEESLFLTSKGKPVYPRQIYRIVHDFLQLVTTLEKKGPHLLRHTFATHLLNTGADINAIKELLGHANLSATQVYTHNTFEKLKAIYQLAHPRAK